MCSSHYFFAIKFALNRIVTLSTNSRSCSSYNNAFRCEIWLKSARFKNWWKSWLLLCVSTFTKIHVHYIGFCAYFVVVASSSYIIAFFLEPLRKGKKVICHRPTKNIFASVQRISIESCFFSDVFVLQRCTTKTPTSNLKRKKATAQRKPRCIFVRESMLF